MLSSSSPARRALAIQRLQRLAQRAVRRERLAAEGPGHERPDARTGAGESLVLELAVGLEHRVGVDGELCHDLLDRRQLIALVQESQPQRLADLLDDLEIGGDAGAAVQVELDHEDLIYLGD